MLQLSHFNQELYSLCSNVFPILNIIHKLFKKHNTSDHSTNKVCYTANMVPLLSWLQSLKVIIVLLVNFCPKPAGSL